MADRSKNEAPRAALISVQDVSNLLGVSTRSVHRLCDGGAIPRPVRLGGRVLWRSEELDLWITAGCPKVRQAGAA